MKKKTNTKRLFKKIVFVAIGAACCSTYQLSGIFYTASLYQHPQTGSLLWLFSDVHVDVDSLGNLTRMHQKQLLNQAKKQQALVITETKRADLDRIGRVFENIINPILATTSLALTIWNVYTYKNYSERIFRSSTAWMLFIMYQQYIRYKKRTIIPYDEHIQQLRHRYAQSLVTLYDTSPLFNIIHEAEQLDIPALDIEFRHNILSKNILVRIDRQLARLFTGDPFRYPITVGDYYTALTTITGEILSYQTHDEGLADWYQKVVQLYSELPAAKAFRELAEKRPSVDLYEAPSLLADVFNLSEQQSEKYLNRHEYFLLDARIVRAIEINTDNFNSLFICAGGAHIANVIPVIEYMGYERVYVSGENNHTAIEQSSTFNTNNTMSVQDLDHIVINLETFFEEAHAKLAQESH